LSILSLSCWAARVLLRKSLPIPIAFRVFPALSCSNFRVLGLILRSLIHFELRVVQGDRHRSSFSFLLFSQQHLLKRLSILHHVFGTFVKNKVGIAVWEIPLFYQLSSTILATYSFFSTVFSLEDYASCCLDNSTSLDLI
jgi:hypothetical protein